MWWLFTRALYELWCIVHGKTPEMIDEDMLVLKTGDKADPPLFASLAHLRLHDVGHTCDALRCPAGEHALTTMPCLCDPDGRRLLVKAWQHGKQGVANLKPVEGADKNMLRSMAAKANKYAGTSRIGPGVGAPDMDREDTEDPKLPMIGEDSLAIARAAVVANVETSNRFGDFYKIEGDNPRIYYLGPLRPASCSKAKWIGVPGTKLSSQIDKWHAQKMPEGCCLSPEQWVEFVEDLDNWIKWYQASMCTHVGSRGPSAIHPRRSIRGDPSAAVHPRRSIRGVV